MTAEDAVAGCVSADDLREVELFASLDGTTRSRLASVARRVELAPDDVLFDRDEPAEAFYVVLSGGLLLTVPVEDREEVIGRYWAQQPAVRLDDRPSGAYQFTGELPLMQGGHHIARARAVGATVVAAFAPETLRRLVADHPAVGSLIVQALVWWVRAHEERAQQAAVLEALDTLVRNLTHQMNNPIAVLVRTASDTAEAIEALGASAAEWGAGACPEESRLLERLCGEVLAADEGGPSDALVAHDVDDDQDIDELLVDHLDDEDLTALLPSSAAAAVRQVIDGVRPEVLSRALRFFVLSCHARLQAVDSLRTGRRLADLVDRMKSYADLDRTPQRLIDVAPGLDAALTSRAAELADVTVKRDYDDGLPQVEARPAELNQVWTALIDNALAAMSWQGSLRIGVTARAGSIMVSIADSGPGISSDVLPRVFQPFFSTRPLGEADGLGLHSAHRLVTERHGGSIELQSTRDGTVITVHLPVASSASPGSH